MSIFFMLSIQIMKIRNKLLLAGTFKTPGEETPEGWGKTEMERSNTFGVCKDQVIEMKVCPSSCVYQ